MSRRTLLITIVTVMVVGVLGGGLWWYFSSRTPAAVSSVTIPAKNNQSVTVKSFLPAGTPDSTSPVDIFTRIANGQYSGLSYDQTSHIFTLSFNAVDFTEFSQQRVQAEKDFLTLLGITETQACLLLVEERNTPSPDPTLNGRVFPLSFCQ